LAKPLASPGQQRLGPRPVRHSRFLSPGHGAQSKDDSLSQDNGAAASLDGIDFDYDDFGDFA